MLCSGSALTTLREAFAKEMKAHAEQSSEAIAGLSKRTLQLQEELESTKAQHEEMRGKFRGLRRSLCSQCKKLPS